MTQLTDNYFAVKVPEDANEFIIEGNTLFALKDEKLGKDTALVVPLPAGSWSFICTSTEITEEQCKEIVANAVAFDMELEEPGEKVYKDYINKKNWHLTALESFHSLLRSKSLGRVAIIKKV